MERSRLLHCSQPLGWHVARFVLRCKDYPRMERYALTGREFMCNPLRRALNKLQGNRSLYIFGKGGNKCKFILLRR